MTNTDTASILTANTVRRRPTRRAAVRHARNADASWATADALYTLAKHAEELAASENGAGPLSDEARRLFRAADEYQADGDDEAQKALALGYVPDEDDLPDLTAERVHIEARIEVTR